MSRLESAISLLLQSPPGQTLQVYHDLCGILLDPQSNTQGITDEIFAKEAEGAMKRYNEQQLIIAQLEGEQSTIICKEAECQGGYLHPRAAKVFTFDHMKRTASEVGPAPSETRSELDPHLKSYVADRYRDGVSSVFTLPSSIVFHHVGNRYHLSNFWSGRWRSSYKLDLESKLLTCSLSVQIHYFENGNVQLNASKPSTVTLGSIQGKEVVRAVEKLEDAYQAALERTYDELAEKAFKALRRQLPVTRQKVDWDKVTSYKLGAELSK